MVSRDATDDLPRVPITEFKTNPAAYLRTGAVVTTHGRPRATFIPVDGAERPREDLDQVKAQLRMLARLSDPADVAQELAVLAASRDEDVIEAVR